MEFSSVAHQVHSLYEEGRFQDALEVIDEARTTVPEQDGRLTFWEACLYAKYGKPERAIEALAAGTRRGLWWPQGMLSDNDLDAAREHSGWDEVLSACVEQEKARLAERPDARIREGSGNGTVLALHGVHADPVEFARSWETAVPSDWTVITPVGDLPTPEGGWSWAHDKASRIRAVMTQVDAIPIGRPLILAGFSAGAVLALELAAGELPPDGLVLLAPFLQDIDGFNTSLKAIDVLVLLAYGTDDPEASRYQQLDDGVSGTILFEGLGHALPPDLAAVFQEASDLIAEN